MTSLLRHRTRLFGLLLVVLGIVFWIQNLQDAQRHLKPSKNTRDFASYFIASQAARAGRDPYGAVDMTLTAREHGLARVHPFFYPPPFLLSLTWTGTLSNTEAYRVWTQLDLLASVGCILVLALWWRSLHPLAAPLIVLLLGLHEAIPNNHVMGQVNHGVLLLTLIGLWAEDRQRPILGGVFLGLACMAKMSPALLVAWWLLRRRWLAVGSAVATAVLSSVAALWVVPFDQQVRFYTEILPQFASGRYNGLMVPIGMFANHSVPNVLDQIWPAERGLELSQTAQLASRMFSLAGLGVLALLFRREPTDDLARAAQVAAVTILMLLVPVYTYEHHLVWALPAMAVALIALADRRLPLWTVPFVLLAVGAICLELRTLKQWNRVHPGWWYRESKFIALVWLGLVSTWLGWSRTAR